MRKRLNKDKKDKEARLLLFEYAMHYHQPKLFAELANVGFVPALKPKKIMTYLNVNILWVIHQIIQHQ